MASSMETLVLIGEITIYTAESTKSLIVESLVSTSNLVVDLSQITELDAAGLQLLILAKKEALRKNINISFVGHSDATLAVFELCNVSSFFGDPVVIPGKNITGSQKT